MEQALAAAYVLSTTGEHGTSRAGQEGKVIGTSACRPGTVFNASLMLNCGWSMIPSCH
jgi:hypothetical protein